MSSLKIRKGDTVRVIAGKDSKGLGKGKEGKVIAVDPKKRKILVEGVNMITKHTKPSASNPNGGIVQKEAPIDISNVMLLHKGKITRVGFKRVPDEKREGKTKVIRIAKATGEEID